MKTIERTKHSIQIKDSLLSKSDDYLERNKKAVLKWRKKNKEKALLYNKRWRDSHPEKMKEIYKERYIKYKDKYREHSKKWRLENPEKHKECGRRSHLKTKYNITLEQYNELFQQQKGECAICGIHQSKLKQVLYVDHNHLTNQVRGLLCPECNTYIGYINEDPALVYKMIEYFNKYKLKRR